MAFKLHYNASATASAFHNDNSFVRGIMGPVGSGKSVACCVEVFLRAKDVPPDIHGVRRSRWAIIRNTYPMLKTTTLKTWQEWFPPGRDGCCEVLRDYPINGRLKLDLPDGTRIDAEVLFLALDGEDAVGKLLSLELTGAFLNEAREMGHNILKNVVKRVGRFPNKESIKHNFTKEQIEASELRVNPVPLFWAGVWMDTNPPDDDHWWYKLAEVEQPKDYQFFRQPGAMIYNAGDNSYSPNPKAENVQHLGLGFKYYENMLAGSDENSIKVFVLAQYGSVSTGRPVYGRLYRDDLHCSQTPLKTYNNLPLLLGWDFGMNCACVIGQVSPRGQLRILREYFGEDMGIRQFAEEVIKPVLNNDFPNMEIRSTGDPAGVSRSQVDEMTCIGELCRMGIQTRPAIVNRIEPRLEAVKTPLRRLADGEPGFLLDASCTMLRKGFNGEYCFERVRVSGAEEKYQDKPTKNKYSHPHDALQYLALSVDEAAGGGSMQAHNRKKALQSGVGYKNFTCG